MHGKDQISDIQAVTQTTLVMVMHSNKSNVEVSDSTCSNVGITLCI